MTSCACTRFISSDYMNKRYEAPPQNQANILLIERAGTEKSETNFEEKRILFFEWLCRRRLLLVKIPSSTLYTILILLHCIFLWSISRNVSKFRIPWRPWEEHDCEANAGQLLCKNKKKNMQGNLPLSRWETIEILKIIRFQSLNFTRKPKGGLSQTTKLWEKMIVVNRE